MTLNVTSLKCLLRWGIHLLFSCELGHGDQVVLAEQWRAQRVRIWNHSVTITVLQEKLCAKPSGGSLMGGKSCPEWLRAKWLPAAGVWLCYSRAALFLCWRYILCKMSHALWSFIWWKLGLLGLLTPITAFLSCQNCFNSAILLSY